MPFASKAQARWGNGPGKRALGGSAKLAEWNGSTNFDKLPERAKPMGKENSNPGVLSKAAARSTIDPKKPAAKPGALAARFKAKS